MFGGKEYPAAFDGPVLPARQHAKLFGVGSELECEEFRKILLDDSIGCVLCRFGDRKRQGPVIWWSLIGDWRESKYGFSTNRLEFLAYKSTVIQFIPLRGQNVLDSPSILFDESGVLTASSEDVESQAISDVNGLLHAVMAAQEKAAYAHVRVPYTMCVDLLELAAKLEKDRVSTEVFVKRIDKFLSERGIEKVAA
jgi:hypothetical protein